MSELAVAVIVGSVISFCMSVLFSLFWGKTIYRSLEAEINQMLSIIKSMSDIQDDLHESILMLGKDIANVADGKPLPFCNFPKVVNAKDLKK